MPPPLPLPAGRGEPSSASSPPQAAFGRIGGVRTQMRPTVTRVPARLVVTVAATMVAIAVGGCSPADRYRENIVTGTVAGGKLIALNPVCWHRHALGGHGDRGL